MWHSRYHSGPRDSLHNPVLHRGPQTRQVDSGRVQDRPRYQRDQRHIRGNGVHSAPGHMHKHSHMRNLCTRILRRPDRQQRNGLRTLRNGRRNDRDARIFRVHPRRRHLRTHHRQRWRHRRNERPACRGKGEDRQARCFRKHHQSSDQGIRHGLRFACGVPPVRSLLRDSRRDQGNQPHRGHAGQPGQPSDIRRRTRRSRARVLLRIPRHQRGRKGRRRDDRRGPQAVQGEPRHNGGIFGPRLCQLRRHRYPRCPQADGPSRTAAHHRPDHVRAAVQVGAP